MQNLQWTQVHTYLLTHAHTNLLLAYKVSRNWSFLGICAITWMKLISKIDLPVKFCNIFLIFSFKQFSEKQWAAFCLRYAGTAFFFPKNMCQTLQVITYSYLQCISTNIGNLVTLFNRVNWRTISSCMYIYHIINKNLSVFFF